MSASFDDAARLLTAGDIEPTSANDSELSQSDKAAASVPLNQNSIMIEDYVVLLVSFKCKHPTNKNYICNFISFSYLKF